MDSTECRRIALHVGVDGRLRYQTVKTINDKNVIRLDFSNAVSAAA
jgi:hypothetical protein